MHADGQIVAYDVVMVDDGDTVRDAHAATLAPVRTDVEAAGVVAVGSSTVPIPTVDLAARYRVGDVIGKGGMGEIVAAVDAQIGRDVAIKRIRGERLSRTDVAR